MTQTTYDVARVILVPLLAVLLACTSKAPPVEKPPVGTSSNFEQREAPGSSRAGEALPRSAEPGSEPMALDPRVCTAVREHPAAGVVRIAEATPDCSGVGHLQLVFEVVYLARGAGLRRLYDSVPLYSVGDRRARVGDLFIAAIDPAELPARNVNCVPLPALDGHVRDRVPVESLEQGQKLLQAALDPARPCP